VPIFIGRGAPTTLRRDLDCLPANKKRSRRLAEHLTRMDLIVVNELGYLHFAQAGVNRHGVPTPISAVNC
jgi:hypothetical protein